MKNYRPLLFQTLNLRLPGLQVHRLSLNQHLPEKNWLTLHSHRFSQFLLYMSGAGIQTIDGRSCETRAGSLVLIRPDSKHAFKRISLRRPICLAIDFELSELPAGWCKGLELSHVNLTAIRQRLSALAKLNESAQAVEMVRVAALVLDLFHELLRASRMLTAVSNPASSPIVNGLERFLHQPQSLQMRPSAIADQYGYQKDYLSRRLKQDTGLTLGQYRSRKRLEAAKGLLKGELAIQAVAELLGFSDQNYFARWFRQQTGSTPTTWRSQNHFPRC